MYYKYVHNIYIQLIYFQEPINFQINIGTLLIIIINIYITYSPEYVGPINIDLNLKNLLYIISNCSPFFAS